MKMAHKITPLSPDNTIDAKLSSELHKLNPVNCFIFHGLANCSTGGDSSKNTEKRVELTPVSDQN